MRSHLVIALALVLAPAPGIARNIPGIVVAPEPSPGLVLLLPTPGATPSSEARHTSDRALAQKAVAELLPGQNDTRLTKGTKLFVTARGGTVDEIDLKGMGRFLASCSVEAAADLPAVKGGPAKDYYVVQLACPYEGKPNSKMFAAVGLTDESVVSIVLNVLLTPVWSERG